jgi:hypothetical protein
LLPNGKVLAAGGLNTSGHLASAELYDPAAGTWSTTGSMGITRYQHSATLLPNGKVLAAGGLGGANDDYLASAELYDPAAGTWSATGSLTTTRYYPNATLLPNGKVLVAGGLNGAGGLASAELYDPATGTSSATGSLATGRALHSATLLPNGKVLVVGGSSSNASSALASAELYDVGLGFLPAWQPQITTASSFLTPGNKLSLSGSRFQGISQASSGGFQDSSTNYPVVQLRRLENEQVLYLRVDPASGWSNSTFTSAPVIGFPFGPALATVFTNGIPSDARYLLVTAAATPTFTTQASAGTTTGNPISDAATLSGGLNPTGTITFRLYGPNDGTCGGAVIFSSTKSVSGNGSFNSDSFTPTSAGTYRWVASYSGDANNNGVNGACNDPNELVVVSSGPPPTPTPVPGLLANISTRLRVETGDDALIGGFIVTGTQDKKVIIRGIGPSLGRADQLSNPTLELYFGETLLKANDDWMNSSPADKQAIIDSTIPPTDDLESAIVATLPANGAGYTAVLRGVNNGTGIGVIQIYDLDRSVDSKLANISTRGFVQTGDNALFAGTIVLGQAPQKVIIRALGPSVPAPGAMADPTLELRDGNGAVLEMNDNWVDSPNKQAIIDSTVPPTKDAESAIVYDLPANGANYTAIVRGAGGTTGVALVEVYALK